MALTETQKQAIDKAGAVFLLKRRSPEEMRDQLDIAYRIDEQSVLIFEIRPRFDDPSIKQETPIAKATYVQAAKQWKIFWMRADLKWHGYKPHLTVTTIDEFFELVDKDRYGCFFG